MEALKLKTGFDLEENVDDFDQEVVETTAGLLKVFTEAALETAAQYAVGDGRNVVTREDVIKSLKYQARLFFQENSENIEDRIREAIEEMNEMSDEESSDEDSYEEDSADGDTGGEEEDIDDIDDTDDTDDTDDMDDTDVEIDSLPEEEIKKCRHMKFKIDEIVRTWEKFSPTNKLILNIKNSIEKTEQHFSGSSHLRE